MNPALGKQFIILLNEYSVLIVQHFLDHWTPLISAIYCYVTFPNIICSQANTTLWRLSIDQFNQSLHTHKKCMTVRKVNGEWTLGRVSSFLPVNLAWNSPLLFIFSSRRIIAYFSEEMTDECLKSSLPLSKH